jgi:hypothetical protein
MQNILTLDDVRNTAPAAFSQVAHPRTSHKYSLFNTGSIVTSLVENGWQVTRAGQSQTREASRAEFTRHMVALTRPELRYRDEQIEALFFNSHDGQRAFHLELGVYRFICANGIVDATLNLNEINIRHTGVYTTESVFAGCQTVIDRAGDVVAVIDAWKSKEISTEAQIALAKHAIALRYGTNVAPIDEYDVLTTRRSEDLGSSLWNVFNRVQENVLKGGQSYTRQGRNLQDHYYKVRPIRSIGGNLRINKGLWTAAENLYADKDLVLAA